ncbi:MAG TPA: D-amino-acid transaminase [Pseudogracilibacillus sp.]|nr:D-amino-acid transaminase [Pseudogracilibacillus sp.]
MYTIILSQDHFIHKDALLFPIEERGMQFGDGVYEVIRIYDGRLYLLEEHIDRLFRSLSAIEINIPFTKEQLKKNLYQLIELNEMFTDGFIYMQVTRGMAERNHPFPKYATPNLYAYIKKRKRPLTLLKKGTKAITLPDERWANCYIKSLNLLPNVLAKQKATEQGAYEAILHREQIVTEGSSSNVFLVKNDTIYTHPEAKIILNGCVRMRILRLADEKGITIVEEPFTLNDLDEADELFITSSISEVMPITHVNNKAINGGKVGHMTKQLQQAYETDAQIGKRLGQN